MEPLETWPHQNSLLIGNKPADELSDEEAMGVALDFVEGMIARALEAEAAKEPIPGWLR